MVKDLIEVKQLPIIEEKLKVVSEGIDIEVKKATSLVCTEETVKTVKELRAKLNKSFKEFEEQRKTVKEEIMTPYNNFESIYKECISDKFKSADVELKSKIDNVENELKDKKEQDIKDYFEEYKTAKKIDFITYGQARINVTLSASMKSLKEQAKQFIDKITDDLKLIETQEHKAEILVEYKQTLNVSQAITSVTNRFKAVEEERKRQEELAKKIAETPIAIVEEPKVEILEAPTQKIDMQEEIFTLTFKVKASKTKLKELKEFLVNGGYDYE